MAPKTPRKATTEQLPDISFERMEFEDRKHQRNHVTIRLALCLTIMVLFTWVIQPTMLAWVTNDKNIYDVALVWGTLLLTGGSVPAIWSAGLGLIIRVLFPMVKPSEIKRFAELLYRKGDTK